MSKFSMVLAIIMFVSNAWCGKYVAEFMEIGTSVRAAGMGGTLIGIKDDPSAIWWNPASLTGIKTPQIYVMHALLYEQMYTLDALASRWEVGKIDMGAAALRLATDAIPFTDEDGFYDYGPDGIPGTGDPGEGNGIWDPLEPVDPTAFKLVGEADYAGWMSVGMDISDLSIGFSIKVLRQDIGGYKNYGFGADIGAIYVKDSWRLGLSILDFTGMHLFWSTDFTESKLPTARIGGGYNVPLWGDKINAYIACDVEMKFEGYEEATLFATGGISADPHIGTEISFWNLVYLRGGIDMTDFTAGAGLKVGLINFDYAFVASIIDNVHRIGMTVDFPAKRTPRVQTPGE